MLIKFDNIIDRHSVLNKSICGLKCKSIKSLGLELHLKHVVCRGDTFWEEEGEFAVFFDLV